VGTLLSVDRQGVPTRLTATQRAFQLPRLSPDERQLVVTIADDEETDLWVRDLSRGTMSRLTFEGNNAAGVWTPEQRRIAFSSDRAGMFNLYSTPVDGSGEAVRLTTSEFPQMPTSFSPDGRILAYTEFGATTGFDIWLLHVVDGRREPLVSSSFDEIGGVFSPDGRLVAYVSDESGRSEVYVRAYPDGGKWQISTEGGTEPVWSRRGRELFYRSQEWVVSTTIETEPSFAAGRPQLLFETPYIEGGAAYPNFDVTSDGRFIMIQSGLESSTTELRVVVNWFEELERRAPAH
jgi:Tol biopolymer transport system component